MQSMCASYVLMGITYADRFGYAFYTKSATVAVDDECAERAMALKLLVEMRTRCAVSCKLQTSWSKWIGGMRFFVVMVICNVYLAKRDTSGSLLIFMEML